MSSKELFHSRSQQTCKFMGTKENIYIRNSSTWAPFHCFCTPIWLLWRHVKTLCIFQAYVKFQNAISDGKENVSTRVGNAAVQSLIYWIKTPLLSKSTWKADRWRNFTKTRGLSATHKGSPWGWLENLLSNTTKIFLTIPLFKSILSRFSQLFFKQFTSLLLFWWNKIDMR